jgi:hypothetical protein
MPILQIYSRLKLWVEDIPRKSSRELPMRGETKQAIAFPEESTTSSPKL